MLVSVALIVAGLVHAPPDRGVVRGTARGPARGCWEPLAATVVGTLANDSGALVLMIGTGYTSLFVAYAWAMR